MQATDNNGNGYGVSFQVFRSGTGALVFGSDVQSAADTVLVADGAGINPSGTSGNLFRNNNVREPSYSFGPYVNARHGGKANVGWCDGHAKSTGVVLRPLATDYFDARCLVVAKRDNVGELIHPQYPYDRCTATYAGTLCKQDYYFMLRKP